MAHSQTHTPGGGAAPADERLAERDWVVSQTVFRAAHTGPLFGKLLTGRSVSLASIRIGRFEGGKIAEHGSVADVACFMQQLETP